jgi:acyl CoA:acetate/3-ketoacid CoA transferase beta subunit
VDIVRRLQKDGDAAVCVLGGKEVASYAGVTDQEVERIGDKRITGTR